MPSTPSASRSTHPVLVAVVREQCTHDIPWRNTSVALPLARPSFQTLVCSGAIRSPVISDMSATKPTPLDAARASLREGVRWPGRDAPYYVPIGNEVEIFS